MTGTCHQLDVVKAVKKKMIDKAAGRSQLRNRQAQVGATAVSAEVRHEDLLLFKAALTAATIPA